MTKPKIARPRLAGAGMTGESRRFSLWLTTDFRDDIRREAGKANVSASDLMRQMMELYLSIPAEDRRELRKALRNGELGDGAYRIVPTSQIEPIVPMDEGEATGPIAGS